MKWFLREGLLATSIAALMVTLQPDWAEVVSKLWLIAIVVLGVSVYILWLLGMPVKRSDLAEAPRDRGNLRQMRDIEMANDFLIAVDYQLFPFVQRTIREIARDRLLVRRDIGLDQEPVRARKVLGEQVWELISPDELHQTLRWQSVDPTRLAQVVAALEAI